MKLFSIALLLFAFNPPFAKAKEDKQDKPRTGIAVFDTGNSATEPIAPGETPAAFKGDAVVSNGRISLVVARNASSAELRGGTIARAKLSLMGVGKLDRISLVEHGKGGATLEVGGESAKGIVVSVRFKIKKGDVSVEALPGEGAEKLRVECPSRFIVLPDFFADDIVLDATKTPVAAAEVPTENFILHPSAGGDAIVMCVFENRDQDVRVTLSGEGEKRIVTGSEIRFGKGRKIWVGVLESPRICHTVLQVGEVQKPARVDWKIPFRAHWRADFTNPDGLVGSWTLLLQEMKDGDYVRPSFTGDVHSGGAPEKVSPERVRKGYHACWSDPESQVYLMPLSRQQTAPVLLYPLNRVAGTPPDVFTVVDLARSCLGTGPCDYILDLEGHKDQYKGRATCGVRDILGRIYSAKQQKAKHDDVEKCLNDGLTFVTHIRSRITAYLDFLSAMRQYLAEQNKAHPELQAPLAELEKTLKEMDARVVQRQDKIKTPAEVARMNDDFRKNVLDYEGADALERCRNYTSVLVEIGGNQDELVAECRGVVKILRQRAGLLMALDPRMASVAGEIRQRTQEALRNPAWHEGTQH
jgi:hypothetical protein